MTDKPDDTNASAVTEAIENNSADDTNVSEMNEAIANKSGPTEEVPTAVALAAVAVAVAEPSSSANSSSNATATVFAWVAFILINSAFIALITWGSLIRNWWIGLVLDIVYVTLLLVAGIMLQRRDGWKNSVMTSLVFLVALISMAVAGLYLPLNVFPCSINNWYDDDYYYNGEWSTEMADLPTEVQEWWNENDDSNRNTFAHFESTGITLFEGVQEDSQWNTGLWRTTEEGVEPELVPDMQHPEYFVEAGNSTVCFVVHGDHESEWTHQKVVCTTDGLNFAETLTAFRSQVARLFYANERLWFHASPPVDTGRYFWGDVLYSVNPSNLADVVLHSNKEQANSSYNGNTNDKDENDDGCTYKRTNRIRFLSWLFLSALPALITGIAIDVVHKFAIPTIPIGYYLGFTWLVFCLGFAVDPENFEDHIDDFFRWWLVFTTGPWLVYLTLQHLTNRSTPSRRSWSINFASLVYAASMFWLVRLFDFYTDYFWQWAVLTLALVPPLFLVNVITGKNFVLVVVSVVIMVDVYRLTHYIAWDVFDSNSILPIQFVVLGLSGLLLGYLGYLLSRRQASIETRVSNWASTKLAKWIVTEGNEEVAAVPIVGEEEEQNV